jgi:hypothetical protein
VIEFRVMLCIRSVFCPMRMPKSCFRRASLKMFYCFSYFRRSRGRAAAEDRLATMDMISMTYLGNSRSTGALFPGQPGSGSPADNRRLPDIRGSRG